MRRLASGNDDTTTADATRPSLRRNVPNDETPEDSGVPPAGPLDPVIADAREAAASFTADLPNFLVKQVTTRYRSNYGPRNWSAIDVVTAEVACVNGKEDYRNILVNGRPPQGPVENTGSWSTGEFAITWRTFSRRARLRFSSSVAKTPSPAVLPWSITYPWSSPTRIG